jgi:hypothetical protein
LPMKRCCRKVSFFGMPGIATEFELTRGGILRSKESGTE